MTVEMLRSVLLWCGVINYGLLIFWVVFFFLARDWLHRKARWYRLTAEQFDAINYAGIVFYKVSIFLFNFVPYLALRIVG